MSIECIGYRQQISGALQGFANFRVPKMGLEIFGCGVFMKNGKRWMSLPNREYKDPESGDKKYIGVMKFIEKEHSDAFCKAALKALDSWCEQNSQEQDQEQPAQDESVLPF